MSTKNKVNNPQVSHAIKTVKAEIVNLGTRISHATGAEREELEREMIELTSSIGMCYVPGSTPDAPVQSGEAAVETEVEETRSVGSAMLKAILAATEALPKASAEAAPADAATPADAPKEASEKPTVWVRIKDFVAEHKVVILSTIATLIAAAAAAYYYLRSGTATVPASGMMDAGAEAPTDTAGAELPSFFSRIAGWVNQAAGVVKGYAVSAFSWVKSLFAANDVAPVAA